MNGLLYLTVIVVVVKDREWHDMNFEGVTKINASFWGVITKCDERAEMKLYKQSKIDQKLISGFLGVIC